MCEMCVYVKLTSFSQSITVLLLTLKMNRSKSLHH